VRIDNEPTGEPHATPHLCLDGRNDSRRFGGGASYTGTNGTAYGVFTGGGYGNATDIDACAWPSKHSTSKCGQGTGR
jgi:hypothetical protein